MTFKTNLPARSCRPLAGFGVLAFEGRDAAAFLQAQLMNDVTALAPGQWQWSGWLTPKGRVIAILALLRTDETRFLAVLPDFPAAELQAAMQRFVFRSKVAIAAAADLVAAAGPPVTTPAPDRATGADSEGWALDWGDSAQPRTLHLLGSGDPALAASDPVVDDAWRAADFAWGLPRLPVDQREAWTPQMLSLERLAAFSLKKGCYPGQEIVARTHYLGQAKRALVRLSGAALAGGQAVSAGGKPAGTLVCASGDGTGALAVMTVGAEGGITVEDRPCGLLPLREGLARPV